MKKKPPVLLPIVITKGSCAIPYQIPFTALLNLCFDSWSILQWLLAVHNTQILLSVFLAILALLLGGFCAYHAHLCLTNTTTNEVRLSDLEPLKGRPIFFPQLA